jgi:hypothetical protein
MFSKTLNRTVAFLAAVNYTRALADSSLEDADPTAASARPRIKTAIYATGVKTAGQLIIAGCWWRSAAN